ncbi:FAD-dependent oxidoreductase [Acidicapsa ligni]|uniref:FAD-dependent oxidoreductase n=1 Tax=Acidicapsa ligni TaxID=542300 RepID=UPI0021E092F0|nr:FAD-dependent oxidoreductase [Acidicapsa ligni]
MTKQLWASIVMISVICMFVTACPGTDMYDVVVYGGTSAGITAAIQAARLGKRVVLIDPSEHLGGLATNGLGFTDVGRPEVLGGMAREFYHRVWQAYQKPEAWKQDSREFFHTVPGQAVPSIDDVNQVQWSFEPHIAEQVYNEMIREADVLVVRGRLDLSNGVDKNGTHIIGIRMEDGRTFHGRIYIDSSYEGDVMARAGVSYTVGREANSQYGETINGIEAAMARGNNLPLGIDPYATKGDPASGLLPSVNKNPGGIDGSADKKIQAYCYRLCMTMDHDNRVIVDKPAGYDERDYELLIRASEHGSTTPWKLSYIPNRKLDANNSSGASFDLIGLNYAYPDGDYATRAQIAAAQEAWQRGVIYTIQHNPRVPQSVREKYAQWGLAKDEFTDNHNWPRQLYIREARRMIGPFVETEVTLRNDATVNDSIGMGSYQIDSHNTQRYVDAAGEVRNEGDVQIGVNGPYRISYRSITPRAGEAANLLVPVCLSASHVAYGSLRLEPVFMIVGQSAGTAASIAIDRGVAVQDVPYDVLRAQLLQEHQTLSMSGK